MDCLVFAGNHGVCAQEVNPYPRAVTAKMVANFHTGAADGFICCASMAVLWALNPNALDHAVAGHVFAEPGHRRPLDALGLGPLLDLSLRLGEGSGAALALSLGIFKAALACHNGMASFEAAAMDGPQ